MNGDTSQMKIGVLLVGRHQENHHVDCYLIKEKLAYTNLASVQTPDSLSEDVPVTYLIS